MWKITINFLDAPPIEFWSEGVAEYSELVATFDLSEDERISYPISRIKSISEKYYKDRWG